MPHFRYWFFFISVGISSSIHPLRDIYITSTFLLCCILLSQAHIYANFHSCLCIFICLSYICMHMWVHKVDVKSINIKSEESSPNEFSQEWWSSLYCLSGRNIYRDLSITSTPTGYHLTINHRWESWSKKSYGYIEEHQQLHNFKVVGSSGVYGYYRGI